MRKKIAQCIGIVSVASALAACDTYQTYPAVVVTNPSPSPAASQMHYGPPSSNAASGMHYGYPSRSYPSVTVTDRSNDASGMHYGSDD